MPVSNAYLLDCMIGMKEFPDKFFELAIVDPPYGIGEDSKNVVSRHHSQKKYKRGNWDDAPPPPLNILLN